MTDANRTDDINIADGDNGTIIVTAPESSTFKFSVEIMDGKRFGENMWVLPKERRPRVEELLRSVFGRIGPPVEEGP